MFYLVVLMLFGLSTAHLYGADKCTYGPGYWCSSIYNAKECNAVSHCIQTVWEKQVLPKDTDDVCLICLNMVKESREVLLSNQTQEELKQVFEGSCKLMPFELVRETCIELVDQFIPELLEMLASQMNPEAVCTACGLCNSIHMDMLINLMKLPEENPAKDKKDAPSDCNDCKKFVDDALHYVRTHSENELLDHLLSVCGQLGSLSDGCVALVEDNIDEIYNFLVTQVNSEEACDLIGMCGKSSSKEIILANVSDEPCDFCVAIVKHWKDILVSNTTFQEFKEIFEGICRRTGSFSKECLSLVDEYSVVLYNFLVSEIQPEQICAAFGLCSRHSLFHKKPVWKLALKPDLVEMMKLRPTIKPAIVEMTKLRPAIKPDIVEMIELRPALKPKDNQVSILPRVRLSKDDSNLLAFKDAGLYSTLSPSDKCVLCEFALHFIQNVLEENTTKADIENAVKSVCDMFPKRLAEECADFVDAYGDFVIELLIHDIDPAQVCTLIHLCPAAPLITLPMAPSTSCVFCVYAVTQLQEMLKDNKTDESIRNALSNLCSFLPRSMLQECHEFVDTYAEKIIEILANDLTPDEICVELGLCKSSEHKKMSQSMVVAEAGISQSKLCILCEFVMNVIDDMLLANQTEKEIINAVNFVCLHLPATLQEDCLGFIEQYGVAFIKLLVEQLNPKMICQEVELCHKAALHEIANYVAFDRCTLCQEVIEYLDKELQDKHIQDKIDTILEKICSYFPFPVQKQCQDFIRVYGPFIADMLAELADSKKVCQKLHVCPRALLRRQLVGQDRCTWGPSYWCESLKNARSCDAMQHCDERVWKGTRPAA